ncbi:unnamed protein product [Clonostachys rhizophaga]|uniref:Core domain-containing protein n=1 Tax=Clonostachys rhizophaga TaxID=160324 RepID=A0A9N9YHZ8_9HYPO|nr:unnamed protein product [Clonostachys rhizophaga]
MVPVRCTRSPSTARSFINIAIRRYSSTTASAQKSSPPLDFLVPRWAPSPNIRTAVPQSYKLVVRHDSRRAFATTIPRPTTVCVKNPVKDEDGSEMMLEITPRAAKRLSQIMTKDENPNLALRIQVESGGCHGFQYLMSLITIPPGELQNNSSVVNEDDTIFQFVADDAGAAPTPEGARIILDEPSLDLLKGSKVDFTQELIGSQFKIVDNPYATSSCGCGTSFDIKM